ncbi:HigA family addiction module antitoxin [Escherichia coli]|uniref:HigA family addiction module antitoxin n=1 Tax=Escherichia coli TaxID=562 RepID=UPI000F4245B5|nr:HigA family addiction module antitoxin [Escherichia coli]RNJ22095.1 addiction module antidote protein, HigA family [Escherichia coli]
MAMFNPPHPGEIIADILEDQNIGIRELARALDVAPSTVQRLVSGNATISPEMTVRLAAVLGGTPSSWIRLQTAWSLEKAEREVDVSHLSTKYRPAEISPHA